MIEVRVFYAIEFDESTREYIYEKQQIAKKFCINGKFTRKENIHLTLQFMGELPIDKKIELYKVLDEAYRNKKKFTIDITGIGKFDKRDGSILWVGIQKYNEIKKIYNNLQWNLKKLGYKVEDRPYKPHITIGRKVKFGRQFEEVKNVVSFNKSVCIEKITLMQTIQTKGVLEYYPIYSIKLL